MGSEVGFGVLTVVCTTLFAVALKECYDARPGKTRGTATAGPGLVYLLGLALVPSLLGIALSLAGQYQRVHGAWAVLLCVADVIVVVVALFGPRAIITDSSRTLGQSRFSLGRLKSLAHDTRLLVALLSGLVLGAGISVLVGGRGPSGFPYQVYGTCAAGNCGLNERTRPSAHSRPLGQLRDGDRVFIVCQAVGQNLTNANGVSTRVWDKLDNGSYVTDLFVGTPDVGAGIPACNPGSKVPARVR